MGLSNESVGVLPILWVGGGLQDFSVSSLILEWYDIWFLSGNGASGKHYQSLMKTAGKSTTMLSSHLMSNHSSINDVSLSPLGTNLGFELGWTGLGLGLEWRFGRLRFVDRAWLFSCWLYRAPFLHFEKQGIMSREGGDKFKTHLIEREFSVFNQTSRTWHIIYCLF